VAEGWRRLHNEELHNLYGSTNIVRVINSKRMRWAEHVTRMGKMRNEYNMFVGKPEGKRPHGRSRHRWESDITMDLRELEWEIVVCMHVARDRDLWWAFVNTVMNRWVP
jgi:hypothetical protein